MKINNALLHDILKTEILSDDHFEALKPTDAFIGNLDEFEKKIYSFLEKSRIKCEEYDLKIKEIDKSIDEDAFSFGAENISPEDLKIKIDTLDDLNMQLSGLLDLSLFYRTGKKLGYAYSLRKGFVAVTPIPRDICEN